MTAQPPMVPAFDFAALTTDAELAVLRTQQALRGLAARPLGVRISEELHVALGEYCSQHRLQKWALVESLCRAFLLEQEEQSRSGHGLTSSRRRGPTALR